jgi:hypothetical protein
MFDQPIFSAPLDQEVSGDDPLGLAPTNERLYGAVFPGVNNVVRYIRVYSAICWIVQRIDQYLKLNASPLKKREAKQLFEQATQKMELLITWVNKNKGFLEIAGTGRDFPNHDNSVKLVFESFGSSRASLLAAVAYRPSLTNGLGFLEQRAESTFSCTPAGEALANAFNAQAMASSHYDWLADILALDASRGDVLDLEAILDVGHPSVPEQVAFRAQFFPSPQERDFDSPTRNRWLALNLVLRAVDAICRTKASRGESALASEAEIRACMARGRTSDGTLLPLAMLNTVQAWWAVLQLRQLQRLAVDVIYCVVERWLGKQNIEGGDTAIDSCTRNIGNSVVDGLASDYKGKVFPLLAAFREWQGNSDSLYAAACAVPPDEELDVFSHIEGLLNVDMEFDESGANEAITGAYVALVFSAVETSNLLGSTDTKDVLQKDQDSCSLISLLHLVNRMQEATPDALMAYLIKHWVVLRHFHVVADRSQRVDGKNRFRFVVGDHGLERFNPAAGMPGPAFAQDRLEHILILCGQSGLLEYRDGGYRLSVYGSQRMREAM